MLDATNTVREFALQVPQSTRLFEKLGIDYCCGGGQSLGEACGQAKVPVDAVLQSLLTEKNDASNQATDWNRAELFELIDHIVTKHHVYVKQELPRLESLMHKVAAKHGENHTELRKLLCLLSVINAELTSHLQKEEQILFPFIIEMEEAHRRSVRQRPPMFGSVRNPVHMMELEHDSAGQALKEIRAISNDFTAPEDACMSFRALYQGLAEFEADLHQHIHLENNILFPRAIELESREQ